MNGEMIKQVTFPERSCIMFPPEAENNQQYRLFLADTFLIRHSKKRDVGRSNFL